MKRETYMSQKLACVRFSDKAVDPSKLDYIEGEDDTYEEIDWNEVGNKRSLFRDKLKKSGGNLNHNLIKLKYEKKLPQVNKAKVDSDGEEIEA